MDTYFPKTRRLNGLSGSRKRPPSIEPANTTNQETTTNTTTTTMTISSVTNTPTKSTTPARVRQHPDIITLELTPTKTTPSKNYHSPSTRTPTTSTPSTPIKFSTPIGTPLRRNHILELPTTPRNARLAKLLNPPPVKRKPNLSPRDLIKRSEESRLKVTLSKRELFKEFKSSNEEDDKSGRLDVRPLDKQQKQQEGNLKISSGPFKGLSSSLLEHIRAKEAASKAISPEQIKLKKLIGIAPTVARIVQHEFTDNKRQNILYDNIVVKCFKCLKSNYSTETIKECLDLLDKKIAPGWVSTVEISKGKFMRINKDSYNLPQMLQAIKRFQETNLNQTKPIC